MIVALAVHVLALLGGFAGALAFLAVTWRRKDPTWGFFLAMAAPLALYGAFAALVRPPDPGAVPVTLTLGILSAAAVIRPRQDREPADAEEAPSPGPLSIPQPGELLRES